MAVTGPDFKLLNYICIVLEGYTVYFERNLLFLTKGWESQ